MLLFPFVIYLFRGSFLVESTHQFPLDRVGEGQTRLVASPVIQPFSSIIGTFLLFSPKESEKCTLRLHR